MQCEVSGPYIDANQLGPVPLPSVSARPVEQSGANFQVGEFSRHNETAEINGSSIKIARAIPHQWVPIGLDGHRGHGVCLLFIRYRDNPSRFLRQRIPDAVAALPALLVRPVFRPLVGVLAGQPQLRLIDELQDGGQVNGSGAPDAKVQLPPRTRLTASTGMSSVADLGHFVSDPTCILQLSASVAAPLSRTGSIVELGIAGWLRWWALRLQVVLAAGVKAV